MIHQRKQLAHQALFKALQVRKERQLELSDPICIYDLVEQFGVEIRFVSIPSMEGVYTKSSRPIIILSSERPQVRQVYNCGHEFGHHVFNHGARIDEFVEKKEMDRVFCPEEFLVECFSGFLLMPQIAVQNAFQVRNWTPNSSTPIQIYTIAGLFGVGYSTLITHMQYSLRILNPSHAQKLSKIHPKQIKRELLGKTTNSNLLVVDQHWRKRPIDIQVEDLILAPPETFCEGNCVREVYSDRNRNIFMGIRQGIGRLVNHHFEWASFVRISKKNYTGWSKYRHLEDPDDE